MPPAFRTDPAHKEALSAAQIRQAALVAWLAPACVGGLGLLVCVGLAAALRLEDTGPVNWIATPLYIAMLSPFVSWVPLLLGAMCARLALDVGCGGWATALLFAATASTGLALGLSRGGLGADTFAWSVVVALGCAMGGLFWHQCFRAAPTAFLAPPPK